jgi:hypothetical protein
VVAVLLDELTDVANPFAEISIQIDEGNTTARREKRTRMVKILERSERTKPYDGFWLWRTRRIGFSCWLM